jgi:hypothetical protein
MYSTAVGDEIARRQRIEHAVMAHGDAVIDGDRVEFLGDTAGRLDLARHQLAEVLQMNVTRHELGEGIDHRDDRLAEVAVLHAGGAPEAARAGHVAAMGGGAGTIGGHGFWVFSKAFSEGCFRARASGPCQPSSWHGSNALTLRYSAAA